MRERTRTLYEQIVGGVVVAALAFGLFFAFTGARTAPSGYLLTARFEQVDGLAVGSPVHLAGTRVGEVTGLSLDDRMRPTVEMRLRRGLSVPVDSAAMILSDGMLGSKFVNILPGVDDEMLGPGDRFDYVQNAVIVERLLQRIVESAEERRAGRDGPGTEPKDGGTPPPLPE